MTSFFGLRSGELSRVMNSIDAVRFSCDFGRSVIGLERLRSMVSEPMRGVSGRHNEGVGDANGGGGGGGRQLRAVPCK